MVDKETVTKGLKNVAESRTQGKVFFIDDNDRMVYRETEKELNDLGLEFVGMRVLDVGAHVGTFSILARARHALMVLAYEPCPENYAALLINIMANNLWGMVIPFPLAIAAKSWRYATLKGGRGNSGQYSLLFNENIGGASVTVLTEGFIDVLKWAKPDVVKMDIEGGEYGIFIEEDYDALRDALAPVQIFNLSLHDKDFLVEVKTDRDEIGKFLVTCGFHSVTDSTWLR